jgi:succinate-semialdehyde dehydrogenase/glutarate-semialdehyde dehydrogenase
LFLQAGFAPGVFSNLPISGAQAETLIADPRVHAVTLTGSEETGRRVAAVAAAHLKKSVLELGGSDPFIVLDDAELERTASAAVQARLQNCGQSCIAAKRFILHASIADDFIALLREKVRALRPGDPMDPQTTLAPMARADLRASLHRQVTDSVRAGARLALDGGPTGGAGFFFEPVILDQVAPGMRAYSEELFGPVFIVIRVNNEAAAIHVANDNRYGLGGSVWTSDPARGERVARRLECGSAFVNAIVRSDARLPFGGVKASGYGRELALYGMREFVNAKTLWVDA